VKVVTGVVTGVETGELSALANSLYVVDVPGTNFRSTMMGHWSSAVIALRARRTVEADSPVSRPIVAMLGHAAPCSFIRNSSACSTAFDEDLANQSRTARMQASTIWPVSAITGVWEKSTVGSATQGLTALKSFATKLISSSHLVVHAPFDTGMRYKNNVSGPK
jgi:hypothetical protein